MRQAQDHKIKQKGGGSLAKDARRGRLSGLVAEEVKGQPPQSETIKSTRVRETVEIRKKLRARNLLLL